MDNVQRQLLDHDFAMGFEPMYLDLLAQLASDVRFAPDHVIFREGSTADSLYLVRSGRVSVEIYRPAGGPIRVMTVGPGEVLGWSWLIEPYQWHFDARAIESVRATAIDAMGLRRMCDEDHELGYRIHKRMATVISARLSAATIQMLDLYGKSH